jgi:DNA-binding transcriptional MerR regulator
LFFKELGFPLDKIGQVLDAPDFDQVEALQTHRRWLLQQSERLAVLLQTIDKTIMKLTETDMSLTDEELYEGFTKEQIERYEKEVNEQYDPAMVAESKRRIGKMSKAQWQAIKADGDDVTRLIAALADREPGDPEVQAAIARHHAWIENFYPASADVYRGLGRLYTTNDEFRQTYDKYSPGLADFMQAAMVYYADNSLS